MTDNNSSRGQTSHPFPSRRDLHKSRIPQSSKAPEPASTTPTPKQPLSRPDAPAPVERKSISDRDARPVAPKPDHGYPSRKTLHGTGTLPKVTVDDTKRRPAKPVRPAPPTGEVKMVPPPAKPAVTQPKAPTSLPPTTPTAPPTQPRRGPQQNLQAEVPTLSATAKAPVAQKPKRAGRPSGLRTALILTVLVALLGGAAFLAYPALMPASTGGTEEALDYPGPGEGEVEVTVMPGDMGTDIGEALVDAGVVKTVEGFKRAFDANSAAATIKPGTYTLKKGMTSAGALAALLDEANRSDNAITVTPGQTVAQVTEKMVSVSGFTTEEVEEALADPDSFGLPAEAEGNPEGWLAAGSYEVSSDSTPSSVLEAMVERTVQDLETLDVPRDEWQVVLTKASILEREVVSEDDMVKVARVIENRLANSAGETIGLLQMDSTVLYGVGKSGGIPTTADLETDTPYNTYLNAGLPPTPIASPSFEAIEATLNPEEGDWLYFVTIDLDTGETRFSSNLDEQIANTELLSEWCEANPGKC